MYLAAVLIFVSLFIIDMISKILASQMTEPIAVINNFFYLNYTENRGAAWGMGQGYQVVFVVAAIIFSLFMVYFLTRVDKKNKLLFYTVPVILAGAAGNCFDRIVNRYVIDFFQFNFGSYVFPIFNVADICIVCGCITMMIIILFSKDGNIFASKNKDLPQE